MSRFCFFVQYCIWQVVCIRWGGIQSGEKEKNGNLVVKFLHIFLPFSYQPGVPLEFPNVCKAMQFFQCNKNLNLKTQVPAW